MVVWNSTAGQHISENFAAVRILKLNQSDEN